MYLRTSKKTQAGVFLHEPIENDNVVTLQEILEVDDKSIEEEIDLKLNVRKLYHKIQEVLKNRERKIIEMRFGLNGKCSQTQNEISKSMGISRSYISRIETKAISKLAKEIKE